MADGGPSILWWIVLAACALACLFAAFAKVAFRTLGPVTLEALVDRIGESRTEFLRRSLHAPGPFWFSLNLANDLALLLLLLVLFAGDLAVGPPDWALRLRPMARPLNDGVLLLVLFVLVATLQFVLPVVAARVDRVRFVEATLPVMRAIHVVFAPLSRLLSRWTSEESEDDEEEAAPEEILAYIDVGRQEGILEEEEGELLRNLVTFGDTRVYEVMTPRTDIVGIPAEATVEDLLDLAARSRFSRIPVHRGQLDDIVGVATLKDAVARLRQGQGREPVTSLMHPPYIVPESKRVTELLDEFQARRLQLAIVVDEYGGTAGLATVEDLLEEIVGEIREEHEQPGEDITRAEDGAWLVRGRASLHDVGEALGADLSLGDSSTLGGMLLALCDRVPQPGEVLTHAGHRFEVLQADRRRVQRVRISRADTDAGARAGATA